MAGLRIQGRARLGGEITVSGNKNAALPAIAASLLTDEPVVLHNVPDIRDVRAMLEIAAALGAQTDFDHNTVTIKASGLNRAEISREDASKLRTSILFAAPLLARLGRAKLYPPGGDVIGRRRLDGHFYALKTMGALLADTPGCYELSAGTRLRGRELFLDEASVTATEQIMIAAAAAEGVTTLYNAACEPHISDLGELLNAMGARISGTGTNTIRIEGVDTLHGAEFTLSGDHIEAGSFLALAAATGSGITVRGIQRRHCWMTRRIFERFGIVMELNGDSASIPEGQSPRVMPDFGGAIPVIADGPWPQYPSDMMSCTIVMATQAAGTVLFFEKMFESRIYFVDRLISMGANAVVCDPHRVVISGRSELHGTELSSPDIRAGMALVIAAMCAHGTSVIHSCEVIYRGYERLVEKLQAVGGMVETI